MAGRTEQVQESVARSRDVGHWMLDSLKPLLRASANRFLHRFGFTLAPYPSAPPIHLRDPGIQPASARYFSAFRPVLVDVAIERGRGLRVFRLDSDVHPFVNALRAAPGEDRTARLRATLRAYYEMTRPASAAQWLDLPAGTSPLCDQPPWAVTMPWESLTPEQWRAANERYALKENLEHQLPGHALTIDDGWHFWGPVSEAKLEIETRRLSNLAASVLEKGILRHDGRDGDVCAVVLTRDADWCWQVLGGEHRAAAFSALGYETMPVRVLQVVSRADVDHWPGVLRGCFSRQSALATFDMVFDGRLPNVARRWRDSRMRRRSSERDMQNGSIRLSRPAATPPPAPGNRQSRTGR
jgi:hypothetical protein